MYHLNNQLPAPYELNHPMQNAPMAAPQPQAFARGGRAKHPKMVVAHFNPKELHILDHIQGKIEKCPKSGMRSYSHLEELLKNPHIIENVHHHAAAHHHASGGHEPMYAHGGSLEHLREGGRNGDTEIALIGPHTHHLFNQLAGHATRNPHTGHPEYWSLGGALSGLWNTVKGVASKALPAVLPMAQKFLGNRFGNMGNLAGKALGALAPMAQNALGDQSHNPIGQAIGSGLGHAMEARQGGASMGQALGQGLAHTGSRFGGSALGEAMEGAGNALGQGQGFGQALRQGAGRGFERMGGLGGVADMARNVIGGRGQPGGMRGAMMQQGRRFAQEAMPNAQAMARKDLWDQYNDMDNF